MAEQDIQKTDLYLLLDSYKNSVEISTVIMEQLRQIADLQNKFNDGGRDSLTKQQDVFRCLENIVSLLKKYSDDIESSNTRVHSKITDFEKNLSIFEATQEGRFGKVGSKINLVYVGLGSLVVSLLGIIYLLIEKLHLIAEIAKQLGVGSNVP